jgi:ABC-2 type transport system ATP-binding protein
LSGVIEVQNLMKLFHSKRGPGTCALDGISFEVNRGEIFGLLGPNGAGKSTLVRILTTITRPTSGTARIMGHDVVRSPLEARRHLAVVLQETAVEMLLTVRDNLLIYGHLHHQPAALIRQRMDSVLDRFGLREKQHEKVNDLSVGMRRRLQVAKVFMVDSPIVFLDEATTGMDPLIKRETLNLVREEARRGRTIFLTTQLLDEAEELCHRLLIINRGRIVASGDMETLRSLASKMFRVTLTLAQRTQAVSDSLRAWNPVSLEEDGNSVEMTFKGEESQLLSRMADLSSHCPIVRFEIRGADLEDIFVELLGAN